MKNSKKFLMNPWTVAIGSGIFLIIMTIVIEKGAFFRTLKVLIAKLWHVIITILNIEVKIWWILVGVAFIILVFLIILNVCSSRQQIGINPKFLEYTSDRILEYKWKWDWIKDSWGKYKIKDLHPVCPQCETPLVQEYVGYGSRLKCLRCNYETNKNLPELEHVEMLIHDNIRRNEYTGRL